MAGPDLDVPEDNLRAFVRVRASTEPVSTVTWFTGTVHAWGEHVGHVPLFRLEGYNAARAVAVEGGFDVLTREAVYYRDLDDRDVLDRWANPLTGEDVEVEHIFNDPVNQRLRLDGPRGPWRLPASEIEGRVTFDLPVFLRYPSPLPTADYPRNSQSDTYRAAELFQFFARRSDLDDPELAAVPADVSWVRLGPWLPWMRMAQRPGELVYHAHGTKLAGGFDALPGWLQDRVRHDAAHYAEAPETFVEPNQTSWTTFRERHQPATA